MPATRYQEGSIARVHRAKGPDVWVFRYRDAERKHRARTIGTIQDYATIADAKRANDNFRTSVNATRERAGKMTVRDAWGHFQLHELRDPDVDRSPTTIQNYLDSFKSRIIPDLGNTPLDEIKAVAIEKWLRSLTDLAPGTRAKIRNHLSSLFRHCIRHELYVGENPIKMVRQSAKRLREPETLTVAEMLHILDHLTSPVVMVMVKMAAATALRRSEFRGLKWEDLDFDRLWFNLRRGIVRKMTTKMKTEASRRGIPMMPELAEVLKQWRKETPYPRDQDWVCASPFTDGERPYWCESALKDYLRPAAAKAGITKRIGWHTFRHSLGTLLDQQGERLKIIQELLRHANSRITAEAYLHVDRDDKRSALSHVSGLFVVPAPKAS